MPSDCVGRLRRCWGPRIGRDWSRCARLQRSKTWNLGRRSASTASALGLCFWCVQRHLCCGVWCLVSWGCARTVLVDLWTLATVSLCGFLGFFVVRRSSSGAPPWLSVIRSLYCFSTSPWTLATDPPWIFISTLPSAGLSSSPSNPEGWRRVRHGQAFPAYLCP